MLAHSFFHLALHFERFDYYLSIYLYISWTIDRTLSSATTPGQSRPGRNVNEISMTGATLSNGLMSRTVVVGVLLFCRDAVGVFYSPSQFGCRLTLVYLRVRVHLKMSLMSSSQRFWIICEIGRKWPDSCCLVRYCFQVFIRTAEIRFPHDRLHVNSNPQFIYMYVDMVFSEWDAATEKYGLFYTLVVHMAPFWLKHIHPLLNEFPSRSISEVHR